MLPCRVESSIQKWYTTVWNMGGTCSWWEDIAASVIDTSALAPGADTDGIEGRWSLEGQTSFLSRLHATGGWELGRAGVPRATRGNERISVRLVTMFPEHLSDM